MITFYEGMPRSGKSFTAVRDEIIPALKKGRKVIAYIEGLDHIKISAVAEIELETCRELLIVLTREMVVQIHQLYSVDALIVIDEAQSFWRTGRTSLDQPTTDFVAEHGHYGLDIVLMGQSIKDLHPTWRRRVERKVFFLKKTAVGMPNSYSATFFTAVLSGDDVLFEKVTTQNYKYDEKYFGTYKSHKDETTNKDTKIDQRAVIWNHPIFKRVLPVFGVLMAVAVYYVYHFFNGGFQDSLAKKNPSMKLQTASASPLVAQPPPSAPPAQPPEPLIPPDVVELLTQKNKIRLLGFLRVGSISRGFVEWRDSGDALSSV